MPLDTFLRTSKMTSFSSAKTPTYSIYFRGGHFETLLDKYEQSDLVDWKVVAKDSIVKHKKAGMALRGC